MTIKKTASELAAKGRYGDTELVHMSKSEIQALRSGLGALTGEDLTRNPHTGLLEAFRWESLIPAVVGIGATVMSGGTLSPLAAGLISGATTTAVTGSAQQGLMSGLTAGAMSGLGAGINEMSGAAAGQAAGAATGDVAGQAVAAGAADAGMSNVAVGAVPDWGATIAQGGADTSSQIAAAGAAEVGHQEALNQGLGSLGSVAAENAAPAAAATAVPAVGTGTGSTFQEAFMGDNLGRTAKGALGAYGSIASGIEPGDFGGGDDEDEEKKDIKLQRYARDYTYADPSYTLTGGEPQMFSNQRYEDREEFAQGGLASLDGDMDMVSTKRVRALRARYRSRKQVLDDLRRSDSYAKELGIEDPNDPILDVAFGYTKKQGKKSPTLSPAFAGGGRVKRDFDAEWQEYKKNDPNWAKNLGVEEQDPADYMDGPRTAPHISNTINAPKPGRHKPSRYSDEPENRKLNGDEVENDYRMPNGAGKKRRVYMAGGGMVQGQGDGMSDGIMTSIEGKQPAALSNDEYVVPADAVSHIGNGSSQAGARQLDSMVARIRQVRTGRTEQAPQVDPQTVMPA